MDVKETLNKGLKREFELTFSSKTIDEKINAQLLKFGKKAKLPGFRPGKVPLAMLKQYYLGEATEKALSKMVDEGVDKVIKDNDLRPALRPEIDAKKKYEDGSDLVITVQMEVLPEVPEIKLDTLKVEKISPKVDQEAYEKVLFRFLRGPKSVKAIEKDRAIKKGDVLDFDFTGSIDGKEFEGGKAEHASLIIGSGEFIEGFEDQLIGKKKGENFDIKVKFPKDYGAEHLNDKDATFSIFVHEILEPKFDKLTEEAAKEIADTTLEQTESRIKKIANGEFEEIAAMLTKRNVLDAVFDSCKIELPEKMVEMELDTIWHQMLHEMDIEHSCSSKDASDNSNEVEGKSFKDATGKSEEEVRTLYKKIAERRVLLGLALANIGQKNNVTIGANEMMQAIYREAYKYGADAKKFVDYAMDNANIRAAIRAPLFEDKVVEFILSRAKIDEKELPSDELAKRLEKMEEEESLGTKPSEDAGEPKPKKTAKSKK